MTRNPRTHDMIAAGPAIDDDSHAPNSQPDPIKEPNPNKTNWDRLIFFVVQLLVFNHKYSFVIAENSKNSMRKIIRLL